MTIKREELEVALTLSEYRVPDPSGVLDLLNVTDGDTVDDLFPGTGVMGRIAATVSQGSAA